MITPQVATVLRSHKSVNKKISEGFCQPAKNSDIKTKNLLKTCKNWKKITIRLENTKLQKYSKICLDKNYNIF